MASMGIRRKRSGSIVFFDQPETNLHPAYIVAQMTLLMDMAAAGVQVYLATHSYFVVKQLHLLARQRSERVVFCSLTGTKEGTTATFADLAEGLPDNPIIDEAVALYERELMADLKR